MSSFTTSIGKTRRQQPNGHRRAATAPSPALIESFFSENGTFADFLAAQKKLLKSVSDSFLEPVDQGYEDFLGRSTPRKNMTPLASSLTPKESMELLLQHVGLNGEFGNGLVMGITQATRAGINLNSNQKFAALQKALGGSSQLELAVSKQLDGVTNAHLMQQVAGLTNGRETKAEALKRCGRMIEKHLEVNADNIPDGEKATIREHLAAYTALVDQVLSFVEAHKSPARSSGASR